MAGIKQRDFKSGSLRTEAKILKPTPDMLAIETAKFGNTTVVEFPLHS